VAESYEHERRIAELAAQKAVIVPKKLPSFVEMGEFCKGDTTSVSLADFAAQALPVAAIHHNFPGGTIVGESMKRKIADRVWELDLTTHLEPAVEASGGINRNPCSAPTPAQRPLLSEVSPPDYNTNTRLYHDYLKL